MESIASITTVCQWCGEPITDADLQEWSRVEHARWDVHYECGLRSAVGSVGHQKRECSCYGGDQEDPPGMTRREAALAATRCFFGKARPG